MLDITGPSKEHKWNCSEIALYPLTWLNIRDEQSQVPMMMWSKVTVTESRSV